MAPAGDEQVAGIVLAGGRSARMGRNKALMVYRGRPLIEHMNELLCAAGCGAVYISGEVPGYDGIEDRVRHDGPGRAVVDLLARFDGRYEKILFVPVDMPLIAAEALAHLRVQAGSAFYADHPLPACLMTGRYPAAGSVRALLARAGAQAVALPPAWAGGMANINTQDDWEAFLS